MRWEGALAKDNGVISDLSRNGCFVLTGGKVKLDELVWLEITLPGQEPVRFWAEVVDAASEIGFAVRFSPDYGEDHPRLAEFVESVFQSPPEGEDSDKSKS